MRSADMEDLRDGTEGRGFQSEMQRRRAIDNRRLTRYIGGDPYLQMRAKTKKKTKPKVELRRYEKPVFRFKRYRTVRALHRVFMGPEAADWKPEDFVAENSDGTETSGVDLEQQLLEMGVWGFADTRARPPVIHFWHDGQRSEQELLQFFGHEMGHLVGKPAKSGWPEENRADDYGFVAQQAAAQARKFCRKA